MIVIDLIHTHNHPLKYIRVLQIPKCHQNYRSGRSMVSVSR